MRRWLLAVLVAFTAANGTLVWVSPSQVVLVGTPKHPDYDPRCNTLILLVQAFACVIETPADVVSKLEQSK